MSRLIAPPSAPAPARPEARRLSAAEWIKANLFSSPFNSALTIVFGAFIAYAGYRAVRYLFVTAHWDIVRTNMTNFMVGFYPRDEIWRVWTALFLLSAVFGLRAGLRGTARKNGDGTAGWRGALARVWPLLLLATTILWLAPRVTNVLLVAGLVATVAGLRAAGRFVPDRLARWRGLLTIVAVVAAFEIIAGFGGVGYDRWRGLLLTMFLATAGIALSFPIGVLLALGRRSSFPAIRTLSVGYIELIRGVPLITLLFMGFLIVGFFLPRGSVTPSLVSRALIAMVLFTAAYVAEIVRGGLQSVPKGQTEAGQALGLSPVRITAWLVLPQALRNVIPATVGQFISLFKDTSLAAGIGLIELLGVAQQVVTQPRFIGQGLQAETLFFASVIYWTGAYWMSRTSQRLEKRLGVGER